MVTQYRKDLDGLRAVAVILVTFFHYKIHRTFEAGFLGVDIFFVLSGYFITEQIVSEADSSQFSFAKFYLKRCHRLLPAFIFHLFISIALAIAIFPPSELIQFSQTLISALTSTSNFYFWKNSNYFDPASELNPLLHTWSLSVEEQFYLVWPLLLIAIIKVKDFFKISILLIIIISSLILSTVAVKTDPNATFYLMPFRVFELAIGALAVFINRGPGLPQKILQFLPATAILLILASLFKLKPESTIDSFNLLIPCIGTLMLIVCKPNNQISNFLSLQPLVYLGKISYSFYLFHWPMYVFYKFYVSRSPNDTEVAILLLLTFILAMFSFYYVETPFRLNKEGKNKFSATSGAITISLTCLAITALAGFMTYNGMMWRTRLKSSITGSLVQANAQNPHLFYGGFNCVSTPCHLSVDTNLRSEPRKTIIVIGDSHSKALYAGIAKYFPNYEITFYEASGCPFFSLDYQRSFSDPNYKRICEASRKMAFEKIRETPGSIVILSQNWIINSFTNGLETLDFVQNTPDFNNFIAEQITILVKRLKVKKLVVIGNVPSTGSVYSPLSCISKPFNENTNCLTTEEKKLESRRLINRYLSAKINLPNLVFKDPYEALCSDSKCNNFVNDFPIYSDDNHLSIWGSELVIKKLFVETVY